MGKLGAPLIGHREEDNLLLLDLLVRVQERQPRRRERDLGTARAELGPNR
jgi:hypothetical protein